MKQDRSRVYKQLLSKALEDQKQAIVTKKWSKVAQIEVKVTELEQKIQEIDKVDK